MAAADPSVAPARRLLVVDDDVHTAELISRWYAGQPYEIVTALDGAGGLELARRTRPDVVLLDLAMPGLDGISVARRLKEDASLRSIPVILVTACRDVNAKVEAFAAGADDYITKPFEFEELDARIRAMARKREFLASLESTIADLASSNAQLEQLLMVDEKTGLYNFREFQRRLHQEWERAERYDVPLSLVFLDLDHFKRLNDTLGHQAGDRALQEFATLVAGGARANDIAARYGGEEFAVILPHTDGAMALRVAERIRSAVDEFVFLEDSTPTRISVSAGVATCPATFALKSVDDLVRAADMALYRAKDQGRNRVVAAEELPRQRPPVRGRAARRAPAKLSKPRP